MLVGGLVAWLVVRRRSWLVVASSSQDSDAAAASHNLLRDSAEPPSCGSCRLLLRAGFSVLLRYV
jgi:hypothetical protein